MNHGCTATPKEDSLLTSKTLVILTAAQLTCTGPTDDCSCQQAVIDDDP